MPTTSILIILIPLNRPKVQEHKGKFIKEKFLIFQILQIKKSISDQSSKVHPKREERVNVEKSNKQRKKRKDKMKKQNQPRQVILGV